MIQALGSSRRDGSRQAVDKADRQGQQADAWTWIVIGLVFGSVFVALYGPFVWELTHRASA
jgi:hypothetical protein